MKMCGEKRELIMVDGYNREVWSVCGKRPGHKGVHGPWPRWRMLLRKLR